ncbi:right-handed parallel beta-helix repeat-containing protein, partial [Myxococcota bacterium]|nr:right-handed parallel beta-helix repeat-containing protein [Myxococcota bacterium]
SVNNSHSDDGEYVHDIVIADNHIHDNGDATLAERDIHGVGIGANVQDLWMVDNHLHNNSGDSVQIAYYNVPPVNISNRIYIARNHMHEDQENAVDLKGCRDVIISQNRIWGYSGLSRGVAVGYGTGIVIHEADEHAENVLVLYNEISDCTSTGITVSHSTTEIFLVGNLIHDNRFEGTDEHSPTSPWYPGAGILIRNEGTAYVLGNLVTATHHGIVSVVSQPTDFRVQNNIVTDLNAEESGVHLFIENAEVAQNSLLDHNLYFQGTLPISVRLGTSNPLSSVEELPSYAHSCSEEDPLLTDSAGGDYRPAPMSPAVDTGVDLAGFIEDAFGITLDLDYNGSQRPQGETWDLGPWEQ